MLGRRNDGGEGACMIKDFTPRWTRFESMMQELKIWNDEKQ